jgi:hypothetical protein
MQVRVKKEVAFYDVLEVRCFRFYGKILVWVGVKFCWSYSRLF